jgi:hypothetical protein
MRGEANLLPSRLKAAAIAIAVNDSSGQTLEAVVFVVRSKIYYRLRVSSASGVWVFF